INVFTEFEKYYSGVARRTRIDIQEAAIRQLLLGPDDAAYVKFQRIVDVADAALFRLEKFLAEPGLGFEAAIRQVFVFIDSVVQMVKSAIITTIGTLVIAVVLVAVREAVAYAFKLDWLMTKWGGGEVLRSIWPGDADPDRTLRTVVVIWLLLLGFTVLS